MRELGQTRRVLANGTRAVLGAIFKWANSEDLDVPSAWDFPGWWRETPKERALSGEEIKAVWNIVEKEQSQVKDVLRLILLTGQRPGEVMGMRWEELDVGQALWELPGTRTKNGGRIRFR